MEPSTTSKTVTSKTEIGLALFKSGIKSIIVAAIVVVLVALFVSGEAQRILTLMASTVIILSLLQLVVASLFILTDTAGKR